MAIVFTLDPTPGANIVVTPIQGSVTISDQLASRSSLSFTCWDEHSASLLPYITAGFADASLGLIGKGILVVNGAYTQFGGIIQDVSFTLEGTDQAMIKFTAAAYSCLADRHIIFKVWEAKTLKAIATDVIAFYGFGTESLQGDGVNATPTVLDLSGNPTNGPTIPRYIANFLPATAVLDELSKLTGYSWVIDYDKVLYIRQAGYAAPFTLTTTPSSHFRTMVVESSSKDMRNEVFVVTDISIQPPYTYTEEGNGSKTFFVTPDEIGATPEVWVGIGKQASQVLTFGDPYFVAVEDEVVVIDGQTYTFKDSVSTVDYTVKVGANAYECCRNLAYAINNVTAYGGIYYGRTSSTMEAHGTCEALIPRIGELALTVRYLTVGTDGNGIGTTTTLTGAAWGDTTLLGGVAGGKAQMSVGILGEDSPTAFDYYWLLGTAGVHQGSTGTVLVATEWIEIKYRPIFSNAERVRDQAAITALATLEGTSGLVSHIAESSASDSNQAIYEATGEIRKYKNLVTSITYEVDDFYQTGAKQLRAGQKQHIDVPAYGIHQDFLIESVEITDSGSKFFYTVKGTGNISGIGEAQGNWMDVFGKGTAQGGSSVTLVTNSSSSSLQSTDPIGY